MIKIMIKRIDGSLSIKYPVLLITILPYYVSRIMNHESRITHYESRITSHIQQQSYRILHQFFDTIEKLH